jgi:hypothetical protein
LAIGATASLTRGENRSPLEEDELFCKFTRSVLKLIEKSDDLHIRMNWKQLKKKYSWLLTREDLFVKILVATSGLFIGLMVGKGLQVLFSAAS